VIDGVENAAFALRSPARQTRRRQIRDQSPTRNPLGCMRFHGAFAMGGLRGETTAATCGMQVYGEAAMIEARFAAAHDAVSNIVEEAK
jgi:hypothetical protein